MQAKIKKGKPEHTHDHAQESRSVKKPPCPSNQALLEMMSVPSRTGRGGGIPTGLMRRFEALTGLPMDDVSVHYQSDRPQRIGAAAYTQGTDIYIAPGWDGCLEHELGHVAQQKRGHVPVTGYENGLPVNSDPSLERQADNPGFAPQTETAPVPLPGVVQCFKPEDVEERRRILWLRRGSPSEEHYTEYDRDQDIKQAVIQLSNEEALRKDIGGGPTNEDIIRKEMERDELNTGTQEMINATHDKSVLNASNEEIKSLLPVSTRHQMYERCSQKDKLNGELAQLQLRKVQNPDDESIQQSIDNITSSLEGIHQDSAALETDKQKFNAAHVSAPGGDYFYPEAFPFNPYENTGSKAVPIDDMMNRLPYHYRNNDKFKGLLQQSDPAHGASAGQDQNIEPQRLREVLTMNTEAEKRGLDIDKLHRETSEIDFIYRDAAKGEAAPPDEEVIGFDPLCMPMYPYFYTNEAVDKDGEKRMLGAYTNCYENHVLEKRDKMNALKEGDADLTDLGDLFLDLENEAPVGASGAKEENPENPENQTGQNDYFALMETAYTPSPKRDLVNNAINGIGLPENHAGKDTPCGAVRA